MLHEKEYKIQGENQLLQAINSLHVEWQLPSDE